MINYQLDPRSPDFYAYHGVNKSPHLQLSRVLELANEEEVVSSKPVDLKVKVQQTRSRTPPKEAQETLAERIEKAKFKPSPAALRMHGTVLRDKQQIKIASPILPSSPSSQISNLPCSPSQKLMEYSVEWHGERKLTVIAKPLTQSTKLQVFMRKLGGSQVVEPACVYQRTNYQTQQTIYVIRLKQRDNGYHLYLQASEGSLEQIICITQRQIKITKEQEDFDKPKMLEPVQLAVEHQIYKKARIEASKISMELDKDKIQRDLETMKNQEIQKLREEILDINQQIETLELVEKPRQPTPPPQSHQQEIKQEVIQSPQPQKQISVNKFKIYQTHGAESQNQNVNISQMQPTNKFNQFKQQVKTEPQVPIEKKLINAPTEKPQINENTAAKPTGLAARMAMFMKK